MAIVTQTGGQSSVAINGQSLEFLSQQVMLHCPGAPDSLCNLMLQNTIRDFYYRSTGWREVIGPYSLNVNTGALALVPTSAQFTTINLNPVDQFAQVHLVLDLFLYPDVGGGTTPRFLIPAPRKKFGSDIGPPQQYWMDGPDVAVLYPLLDKSYGNILYAYCSLLPVINSGRLPNIAISHHFDALLYGTLARLITMPNKPWTVKDMTLVHEYKGMYRRGLALARDIAGRGWSRNDGLQQFPNFAGSGSQNPSAAGGNTF